MKHISAHKMLVLALLIGLPTAAEAGPPLICHPFQTTGSALLAWGTGPGWNTPERNYDLRRLEAETLALLDAETSILTRMENLRRATIYATQDSRIAEKLLTAVLTRAHGPDASRLAVFDAGYLIETYKQATHLFGRAVTRADGYAMVQAAMTMGDPVPEMEFAAALMTEGAVSSAHLRRARAATAPTSLLAKNIDSLGW
jgi:hypothetical protein